MFSFELRFLKWLEGFRTDFLNPLFQAITVLGEETLMVLLVVVLWFAVDRRLAQKILFITVGSLCVNGIVKNLVKLPRPFTKGIHCVSGEGTMGYSFPSGHAQGFATWSTALAIQFKKCWLRILVALLILLVAFSRLYLGVHYPGDVIVGVALGVGLSVLGNFLFDRIRDTKKLFLGTAILFAPCFICFLFVPEPLFADFYKVFGMIFALAFIAFLEGNTEALSYDVSWWKKLLRIVIGIAVAFALKEGIKMINVFEVLQISLLFDAMRYFVAVFAVGFLCPMLFKKIKL